MNLNTDGGDGKIDSLAWYDSALELGLCDVERVVLAVMATFHEVAGAGLDYSVDVEPLDGIFITAEDLVLAEVTIKRA